MDKALWEVVEKRIECTLKGLRKNRIEAEYIPDRGGLIRRLEELMPQGASCSSGGSATLDETGVMDLLRSGRYQFYDRYAPGVDQAQIFRQALLCDFYLTGTNALTLDGKLYNIDGRGNRLAAMAWGPDKVIVVAGYNKIVTDLDAARDRMKHIAAPANATRLAKKTPCVATGACQDCASPDRICSLELVTGWQMIPGRLLVLLLGEAYGY